jgi:hypothetical protein
VVDGDVQLSFVGEGGEFSFPGAEPVAVGPAAIGTDQEAFGVGVAALVYLLALSADGFHGEGYGVVVGKVVDVD